MISGGEDEISMNRISDIKYTNTGSPFFQNLNKIVVSQLINNSKLYILQERMPLAPLYFFLKLLFGNVTNVKYNQG